MYLTLWVAQAGGGNNVLLGGNGARRELRPHSSIDPPFATEDIRQQQTFQLIPEYEQGKNGVRR